MLFLITNLRRTKYDNVNTDIFIWFNFQTELPQLRLHFLRLNLLRCPRQTRLFHFTLFSWRNDLQLSTLTDSATNTTCTIQPLIKIQNNYNYYCYYTHLIASFQDNKGKTSLDLNEARDDGVLGCRGISWTICKQSAPHSWQITMPTPHHSIIFTGQVLFIMSNQQCQSTEGKHTHTHNHTRLTAPFPGNLGGPVPERQNQSGFYWSKRQWVAVASAGPYTSLHLAPDR